jgi:hypothetical protein
LKWLAHERGPQRGNSFGPQKKIKIMKNKNETAEEEYT